MAKVVKFKGLELTRTKTVNNILRVYDRSKNLDGLNWYEEANELCFDLSLNKGVHIAKIAGICAALSPLKSWDLNKVLLRDFLNGSRVGHTKLMIKKAIDVLNLPIDENLIENICDILNGEKIKNLFLNIYAYNEVHAVTIDRHALSIACGFELNEEQKKALQLINTIFSSSVTD